MNKAVDAVYENGVLRPLEPLNLEEHQRVTVVITERHGDAVRTHRDRAYLAAVTETVAGFNCIPKLEEIRKITAKDPTSWSGLIISEREERF